MTAIDQGSLSSLADAWEFSLWHDIVDLWFPACIEPRAGFHQGFARDWHLEASPLEFSVFQSRMTWVAATISEHAGHRADEFREYAIHGAHWLRQRFIEASGAVIWTTGERGVPAGPYRNERHVYASAFAIFALAATHRATGEPESLELAQRVFHWLEKHAHDRKNGGYYEGFDAEGKVRWEPEPDAPRPLDAIGSTYGIKSQNAHLHLMEAFSELSRVWPHDLLRERLTELREIMGSSLISSSGGMHAYANPDWTPIFSPFSYGHDIEAAHLLLEADERLYGEPRAETVSWASALADHTLAEGFDWTNGGFYSEGRDGKVSGEVKIWWAQAEGLLGLARVLEVTGYSKYEEPLRLAWQWIRDRQIDSAFGGWFDAIAPDGSLLLDGRKGSMWKAAYHDSRALLYGVKCLQRILAKT